MKKLALLFLALCVAACSPAWGAPTVAAGNADSLVAAVENAASGAVITIPAGTYELLETLVIDKPLALRGAGAGLTTLRLKAGELGPVVVCENVPGVVVLEGLTLTGGNSDLGGGIYSENSSLTVTDCLFTGNNAEEGSGIYFDGEVDRLRVTDCRFEGNSTDEMDGGICVYTERMKLAALIHVATSGTPGPAPAPEPEPDPVYVDDITLAITPESAAITVKQGETAEKTFRAVARATYSDGTTGVLSSSWTRVGNWPSWLTLSGGVVTAKPTASVEPGEYAVTLQASARANGHSDKKEATLTVTVTDADADITGVKLSITTDTPVVTLTPGETKALNFTATATVTYKDGSTKTEPARIETWWRGDGAWPDWMKIHSSFSANPNTVDLTPGAGVGGTTMTCRIAAKTESYNGYTDQAECEFTVTVEAPETFTPNSLLFDKASVELVTEPGGTAEGSVNVMLTLKGSKGTFKGGRDGGYSLVCEKESVGVDWVTSSVDGWKITFRAAPPANQTAGYTSQFTVYVMDKAGKKYLLTSYRVVTSISKLTGYQLTVAPAEVTVLAGAESKVELKDSVRFEKVYENGKRMTVPGAKLTFSPGASDRVTPWMTLDSGDVVTLTPGADVETGEYYCDYRVVADDNGQTETAEGTLSVNVVREGKPAITTETLPDAEIDKAYSAQIAATGLTPISWDISGTLPDGLTFENGKLSGKPTQAKNYTFDVQATNSAGSAHREFTLEVKNQKPSSWHLSKSTKVTKSGSEKGTWHAIFNVTKGTNVDYYNHSTTKNNLNKAHLKKVTKTKGVKAGEGQIRFDLRLSKNNKKWVPYTYKFTVKAGNNAGVSTYRKTIKANSSGKLSVAGVSLAADDDITEDDGVETFEPYRDGETPEDDGLADGVTYFANGSIDEDGNITAVIGAAAETDSEGNALSKEYVYATVGEMLSALADRLDKVVALEFRKGAAVDAIKLAGLANLAELSIDECDVTALDLSGRTGLTSLSLYGCESLTSLNVSGCAALVELSVTECPKLADLNVTGCGALENVEVTDAAITALDLGGRAELANLNLSGCSSLASLNVTGCAGLTDVSLNGTAITELDLGAASGLTSLSLADMPNLAELTLPSGATFDNFTLTGSRVVALTLNGSEKLTSLNLSGNAAMLELDLSGVPALTELDVSGCGLVTLDLSGCAALEKLNANECAELTTINLTGCDNLRELSVGGCSELRALDVNGRSLGRLDLDGLKWLTDVDCSEQFIGGVTMSQSMSLKDYAGSGLYRVTDVQGYDAKGDGIETDFDSGTGVATFASAPSEVTYNYATGLYGNVLDVTLSSNAKPDDNGGGSGRGSSGCSAGGFGGGFAGLAALAFLPWRKRR